MSAIKWLFKGAGIYGVAVLVPYFFMEQEIGADFPPAITHPEFFYGFLGVALAWQVAFFIIALDPVRYRYIIIPGILEKLGYGVACFALVLLDRGHPLLLLGGGVDLALVVAFAWAFVRLGRDAPQARSGL